MIDDKVINDRVRRIETLMAKRLGLGGMPLEQGLRRAGRRIPARYRKHGATLVAAQQQARHPRLSRQIDQPRFTRAADAFETYLAGLDPKARRRKSLVTTLSGIALNLLILGVFLVAFGLWRGWL